MSKKIKQSQLAHLRLRRLNAIKANSSKTGTLNAFYSAKVDYHNEVYFLQEKRGKILSKGERSSWFSHFIKKHGVPKGYRVK